MDKTYLTSEEVRTIVIKSFFTIQALVKIEELLTSILLIHYKKEDVEERDVSEKKDMLYKVLEVGLQNASNWKNQEIQKDYVVFTPKKLKTALANVETIRNKFAHQPVFIDEGAGGVSDLGPGAITFFAQHFVGYLESEFPLKVIFNESFLEIPNRIEINPGTIHGREDWDYRDQYSKETDRLPDHESLFRFYETLTTYATQSLRKLLEIYLEGKEKKNT